MQFNALFVTVAAAAVVGAQAANKHNVTSSIASFNQTAFPSTATVVPTSAFNGSIPSAIPTFIPGNGSFICFPVGSGFVTDLGGLNATAPGNGTAFPTSVGNGTDIPFPYPTGNASGVASTFAVPTASAS